MRKLLLLVLLSLIFVPAFAQFTGNVQGTVTDPNGSAVVGAKVTLTNADTNVSQSFVSNSAGQYYFNRLAPGPYTVAAAAPGFEKTIQPIRITTQETAAVDVQLKVGSATDTVSVTAEGGHDLNPDETRLQYTLSAEEISNFPLQSDATLGLLRSAPGATGIDEGHQNVAINRDTASESANGRGIASNIFLLDFIPINSELPGTSGSGSSGGYANLIPQPDMIAEIALQTTTFSVENGAGSGIQTSITTKSGSNKLRGDFDYNYTGGPFRANSDGSTNNPPFRQQYVSGALGGPIWKDRTFFFGSYFNQGDAHPAGSFAGFYAPEFISWARTNYPNSQNISQGLVPYPADRAIGTPTVLKRGSDINGFNFVNFGVVNCGTQATAANLTPVPCDLPIWDQAPYAATSTNNGAQYNFRLDHTFNESKDRVYASFFRFDQKSVSARIQSTFDGLTPSTGYYLAGNYTHAFTSSLLNEASYGQTRYEFDYKPASYSQSQLLLPYLSGCTCVGLNQIQFLETLKEHQYYGRDSVSWVKGKHNLTFGVQGAWNDEFQDQSATYGRVFFQAAFFYLDYLNDLSDLSLIYTLSANTHNNPGKFIPQLFGAGSTRYGLYAQDSWKVTPNLVLNYGIRWDDFGNPSPFGKNAEQYANVKLGAGSSLQAQVAGLSVGIVDNVYTSRRNNNFLPRAGFAYTLPFGAKNTVVHGGVGLYSDDLNLYDVSYALPTQPPVRLSLTLGQFSTPKAVNSYGTTTVQGPPGGNPYGFQFPNYPIYGYSPMGAPLDANGNVEVGDLYGVNPDLRSQKSLLYNIGFEHQFPKSLVVGLLYSGSNAYDQLVVTDVNTFNGKFQAGSAGGKQILPSYNTEFGKIKFFRNAGISNYNGLIATARQTIGKLTYQASYTWGSALGDPTSSWTDQYNIHSQYSALDGDTRQRLTITQTYTVPSIFGSKFLNEGLGGWSVSNALVGQSGQPFTITDTTDDFNNDGILFDIPVYSGNKRKFNRSDAHAAFFNQGTSVFGANPAFSAPTATNGEGEGGRQNTFRGPGYFDLDTGLSKKFAFPWLFGEHATLALRGEAINLLNHDNFGNPGGSFSAGNSTTTIGTVGSTFQGRVIQIGGRFEF